MWIADNWKEYQVIDTSRGEKLEKWGDYLLIRPDPQVIWDTPRTDKGWKKHERTLSPQLPKAAENGNSLICQQQWTIRLQGAYLQPEAIQLQAHRTFPGTGCQLGLVR